MGIRVQKERDIVQGQLREQSCDPDVRGAATLKVKRDGANAVITWNISTHLGRVPRRRRTRSIYHDAALFPSLFYNIIIIIIRSTINCLCRPSRPIRQGFLQSSHYITWPEARIKERPI